MKLENLNKQSQWRINFMHNYCRNSFWYCLTSFKNGFPMELLLNYCQTKDFAIRGHNIGKGIKWNVVNIPENRLRNFNNPFVNEHNKFLLSVCIVLCNKYVVFLGFSEIVYLCRFATCTRLLFNSSIKQSWFYSRSRTSFGFSSR